MAKTKKTKSGSAAEGKKVIAVAETAPKPAPKKRRAPKKKAPAKNITLDIGSKRTGPAYIVPHHHTRIMVLFFIFAIGLLAGLLCFNLIVFFGAEIDADGSFVNYSSVMKTTKEVQHRDDFDIKFSAPTSWHTVVTEKSSEEKKLYITEGVPELNEKNEAQDPLVIIERTAKKAADVITARTADDTSVDQKTIDGKTTTALILKGGSVAYVVDMKDHTLVITFPEYKASSAVAATAMSKLRNDFFDSISFLE